MKLPGFRFSRVRGLDVRAVQLDFLRLLMSTTVARWAFIRSAMLRQLSLDAWA